MDPDSLATRVMSEGGNRDRDYGKLNYSRICQDTGIKTFNINTLAAQLFQVHMQADTGISMMAGGPCFDNMIVIAALEAPCRVRTAPGTFLIYHLSEHGQNPKTLLVVDGVDIAAHSAVLIGLTYA